MLLICVLGLAIHTVYTWQIENKIVLKLCVEADLKVIETY